MLLLLMIKQTGIPSIFSKNENIYLDTSYKKRKIGKRHYVKLIEMYLFSLDIVLIYQAPWKIKQYSVHMNVPDSIIFYHFMKDMISNLLKNSIV